MKPLYTQKEFNLAKSKDLLPCECLYCKDTFNRTKHEIQRFINPKQDRTGDFCSHKCSRLFLKTKQTINCTNCNNEFEKYDNEIKKSKSGNHFCSQSCSATYNNKNKTTGTRRSKLEVWLEKQLTLLYPNLEIHYNQKSAISSELDIYIPNLNLAFELNGIFHYEPIYGVDKLRQIQTNDISKSKECHDKMIDLCIIDTSTQKYVKPSTSQKYLDIINNIINERLLTS
jgi:hypothetical protein